MATLNDTKFVLSPPGNGIDCWRTWEALAMGAIPIVLNTTIASLYVDMPIMVVQNWSAVTDRAMAEFEKTIAFDRNGIPLRPKLWASYWWDLIENTRKNIV